MREMRALYERTLNRMAGEIDKLEGELRAIYDAGDVPTIGRLYRTGRMRSLVAQAAIEFERYGHGVEALTEAATRDAVRRAQADALELTKIVMGEPPPGVVADALFSKLPTDAIEAMVATTRSGPLAQLLGSFGAMASVDARNALIAGIALGEPPRHRPTR